MGWVIQQGNGIAKKATIEEKPSIPQSTAQTMNTAGFSFYVLRIRRGNRGLSYYDSVGFITLNLHNDLL